MSKRNAARMRTLTKPGAYGDGAGLYLQVRGPDKRSWLYRFTLHGKPHLMGLGTVDDVGRSLPDLIASMQDLHGARVDLFIHQQGLDTTTASGRAMFGMLSVFSEFERAMIQSRVKAGLQRAQAEQAAGKVRRDAQGRRLKAIGRPRGIRRDGSGYQGAPGGRRWHAEGGARVGRRQRHGVACEARDGK